MKILLITLCLLVPIALHAQNYPDDGLDKVRIVEEDKVIKAEIKPLISAPKPKTDRFYYWYSGNAIHSTQGGFSGDLLNGLYNEYYINRNLKTQGNFKRGLKDGVWKRWNEDGTLKEVANWKDGLVENGTPPTLLEKVNIFKKKKVQTDSLAKPHS
jgi:hypothetical protein